MPENAAAEGGFGRDAPSRSDENDRGGQREKEEAKAKGSFDRAMDNANRPDRAPAAPSDTTTVSDDDNKHDRNTTDKIDDRQDRVAGPPGIGAPPSSASPNDADKKTDDTDDRGILDRVADTLTAPPTDAEGNARSTSPVADRVRNHTQNYSLSDLRNVFADDPGLTPEQSRTLTDTAAVMDEVTVIPASFTRPPATPRNAAIEMANAELSVGLEVQRREIETLTGKELDHIDQQIADAKTQRAETLERYEAAQKVSFDDFGAPQQASSFEIEQHANDFKAANDRITALEEERTAIDQARDLPDAIERGFMAEDMYNAESSLRGSHLDRLTDDQLPDGLKTGDMVNSETGFVAGIYENRRSDTVDLVARGTDFGLSKEEFAKDVTANVSQGVGVTTEQYEQAAKIGRNFGEYFSDQEKHAVGHSLAGGLGATMAGAANIDATAYNSAGLHDNTMETLNMSREQFNGTVTNYRVEGELVTTGQESPVVEAAVTASMPGIAAIASIRNSGDPIPNAVGDQRDLAAANPESSSKEKHSMREVMESLFQEQQRVINDLKARQMSR